MRGLGESVRALQVRLRGGLQNSDISWDRAGCYGFLSIYNASVEHLRNVY